MTDPIAAKALETYERFVATREEIDAGRKPWTALADYFTEDAAYIDPAWGRIEGREAIREGNPNDGIVTAGMVVGLIHDIPSCADLLDRMVKEAKEYLDRASSQLG